MVVQLVGDVTAFLEDSVPFSSCQIFLCSFLSSFLDPLLVNRRHLLASLPGVVQSQEFCSWASGASFGRGEWHVTSTQHASYSKGPLGPSQPFDLLPRGEENSAILDGLGWQRPGHVHLPRCHLSPSSWPLTESSRSDCRWYMEKH